MPQAKSKLTQQEFFAFSEGKGDVTYELVNGEAVPKMSPKAFHSRLTLTFISLLSQWCQERGEIGVEWAVTLTCKGEDWVPVPDLLYVSHERLSAEWVDEDVACPVPPELVIEIISPGQSFEQLTEKARDYLDAGVLRVWVVDSKARSITVFYPDAPPQTYRGNTMLTDSLLAGWEFTAEQVLRLAKIPTPEAKLNEFSLVFRVSGSQGLSSTCTSLGRETL